jgi:VWFA-related protein
MRRAFVQAVRVLLLLVALLAPGSRRAVAQGQATFRGGVDLVQLTVVVLDRDRHPVTGLTAKDFTLTEGDEPRAIEAFAAIRLPDRPPVDVSAAARAREKRVVFTNDYPDEGRLVVILFDQSIPNGQPTVAARAIARAAVDALGPGDLAAVVRSATFSGEGESQDFTTDRSRLQAAIDSPFLGMTPAPPNGPSLGVDARPTLRDSVACRCGICEWETLERVADALADAPRRQKMVLFIGTDIIVQERKSDPLALCARVRDARTRALHALDRANVTVHALDPYGLETLQATASGARRVTGDANLERQGHLRVLPDYTGGRFVANTNAPERVVPAIFDESQTYYLLGFTRSPLRRGERSTDRRTIHVHVSRPGVTVRTRTGYYAAAPAARQAPAAAPATAIAGLLPRSDVPLSLRLEPDVRPGGGAGVALRLDVGTRANVAAPSRADNGLVWVPPRPGDRFNVIVGVYDERGRAVSTLHADVTAPPEAGAGRGFAWTRVIDTKPGRYEVRVGVVDAASRQSGSVYGYVEVPED